MRFDFYVIIMMIRRCIAYLRVLILICTATSCRYGIEASHFRGGSISASPVESYPNGTVLMQFQTHFAWRKSYGPQTFCNQTTVASGSLIGVLDYIYCDTNCLTQPNEIVGTTLIVCEEYSGKFLLITNL